MTSIRLRRFIAFTLGLGFTLGILELGMRAASSSGDVKSEIGELPSNAIRIVVLGESTSIKMSENDRDVSWPAVLERKLNALPEVKSSGREVRVINLAQAGTSSTLLVEKFEGALDRLRPDFVISMMGINDRLTLLPNRSWLYNKSYLVRFLHWAWVDFTCDDCYRLDQDANAEKALGRWTPAQGDIQKFQLESAFATVDAINRLDQNFLALVQANPEQRTSLHLVWAIWLLEFSLRPDVISSEVQPVAAARERAFLLARANFSNARDEVLTRPGSMRVACMLLMRLKEDTECVDLIFEGLKRGTPLTPDLLTIALIASRGDDPRVTRLLAATGYKAVPENESLLGTRSAYRRLNQLAKESGFHWFAMQYPTGSVGGLQTMFDPAPDAEFLSKYRSFAAVFFHPQADVAQPSYRSYISNENFRLLAAGENQKLYFSDLFARRQKMEFGHTTARGHELIADNALAAIQPRLLKLTIRP